MREVRPLSAYAPIVESAALAYRDTLRRLEVRGRVAAPSRAQAPVRAAPAAPAAAARAEVARQDTGAAPRTGGAATSAEPRPSYFWDDCVMTGLAVSPHCGI